MKKYFRFAIGFVISAFFLWLTVRGIEFQKVFNSLDKFNLPLLLLGLAIWLTGYLMRGLRWQFFLNHIKTVDYWTSFRVLIIGFAGNNLLPFRAGEVIRAYFLGRTENISKSSVLATIAAERVFDGVAIVILMLIGAFSLDVPDWVRQAILFSSLLFATAFLAFVLMILKEDWFMQVARYCFRFLPETLGLRLENIIKQFTHGLKFLRDGSTLIKIIALTFMIWVVESSFYFIAALSFKFPLSLINALFLKGVINLGVLIPSSPGYVGTFEFFAVQTLALFGIPAGAALAYALIVHLAQYLPISLMGVFFAYQQGGSLFSARENKIQEGENSVLPKVKTNETLDT